MKFRYKKPLRKEYYPALREKMQRAEVRLKRKASVAETAGIVCCISFTAAALATFIFILYRLSGAEARQIMDSVPLLCGVKTFMESTLPRIFFFLPLSPLVLSIFLTFALPVILSLIAVLILLIARSRIYIKDENADANELLQVRSMLSKAEQLSRDSIKKHRTLWVAVSLGIIVIALAALAVFCPGLMAVNGSILNTVFTGILLLFIFTVSACSVDFIVSVLCRLRGSINTDALQADLRKRWLELDPDERARERGNAPKVSARDFISDTDYEDMGLSFAMSTLADGGKVKILRFLDAFSPADTDSMRRSIGMPEINEFHTNLQELSDDGLIEKTSPGRLISSASYSITERALPLIKIIDDLSKWGKGILPNIIIQEAPIPEAEELPEPEPVSLPEPEEKKEDTSESYSGTSANHPDFLPEEHPDLEPISFDEPNTTEFPQI